MEALPSEATEHDLPLVVLSGLGEHSSDSPSSPGPSAQESGTRMHIASPVCKPERAHAIWEEFFRLDGSSQAWNASALPGPAGKLKYRMRATGRTYALPPRKAAPMAQPTSPDSFQNSNASPPRSTELHSPLSPLSPGSPIFPDGIFTPLWFAKHQKQVPALLVAFFDISTANSAATDDQIKADVNAIRAALLRSGYRTKFAAVLVSDGSILQTPGLEERLSSIRRATGLDSKLGLFFIPPMSSAAELASFVQALMRTLQPVCFDVYRDLTKHARRKKTRVSPGSSMSSPVGSSSQALPLAGWNVRYEVKQGVFAEFRQEMDVAERHYHSALEELLSPEGALELTPTWSPRWNEARLLSDIAAFRVLRCHLWNFNTTAAAQSWAGYRARTKSVVTRRGKGVQTYAWAAWETRWAQIMAQLLIRADIPAFRSINGRDSKSEDAQASQIYAVPEKPIVPTDRLLPYYHLHHPSYWLMMAAKSSRVRRLKALDISEEDRVPPGQSPASAVVNRTESYDFYLVPEPHKESPLSSTYAYDHSAEYVKLTQDAIGQFGGASQHRMNELLKLNFARNFLDADQYEAARDVLVALLDKATWRRDGWLDLLCEGLLLLHSCAAHLSLFERLVDTTYELMSMRLPLPANGPTDLTAALDAFQDSTISPVSLDFEDGARLSPLVLRFAFVEKETCVGEVLGCQLTVTSCMNENAAPITLESIVLSFDNSRVVKITHLPDSQDDKAELIHLTVDAEPSETTIEMKADLTFGPADSRIFNFSMVFKESKLVQLSHITYTIAAEHFTLRHSFSDRALIKSDSIYVQTDGALMRKFLQDAEPTAVNVSPKPPKVQIFVSGLKKRYYVDENIRLGVRILNEEGEAVKGTLSSQSSSESDAVVKLGWLRPGSAEHSLEVQTTTDLPHLLPGASHETVLLIKAPQDSMKAALDIVADYTLSKDSTSIRKAVTLDFNFTAPFEGMFDFGPRLYKDKWPDYFEASNESSAELPGGIPQLWNLTTRIHSSAGDVLVLRSAELHVDSTAGDSYVSLLSQGDEQKQLKPGKPAQYLFELYTRKHSLDDRRPTSIESTVEIKWSRDGDEDVVVTRIPAPRLTIPVSEPRVLCTVAEEESNGIATLLEYRIENPSTHFLTFLLTMEASEDFAFSGPKYQSLSLAPLSRHQITYQVIPHDREESKHAEELWVWPLFQVTDSYYQKALRVLPGGPGVKLDEKQNIGVCIPASQSEEW